MIQRYTPANLNAIKLTSIIKLFALLTIALTVISLMLTQMDELMQS